MLLRPVSAITDPESALWDRLAGRAEGPDPQSCGSPSQVSALTTSAGSAAPAILRQSRTSQVALSVTRMRAGIRLAALETRWLFGSPLLGPKAVSLLSGVLEELRSGEPAARVHVIVSGLDPKGGHLSQLRRAFPSLQLHPQDAHAAASLEGGIEGWLSRRSGNFRHNLKRARRKAASDGVWFERVAAASVAQADVCFHRMLHIERQSWKGPARHGLPALRRFCHDLLRDYARRGTARVVIARRGEDNIGFCYGGCDAGVCRGQQTSYRQELAGLSIGTLMHYETASRLAEEGARLHHFGPVQPELTYKASFCEIIRPSVIASFVV